MTRRTGPPAIMCGLVFPRDSGEQALVIWRDGEKKWLEIRGHYDVSEEDPLQQALDQMTSWFISGLMAEDIVTVTPWERYIPIYWMLARMLDES